MPKIPTFDSDGNPNGWVIPVWSELSEPGLRPAQVYITAIAPGARKGPHLHKERRGVFFCIAGRVLVRKNYEGDVIDKIIEPGGEYCFVPCGTPAALYNIGDTEALVLNMPNPSWSKEKPDEWPVENWADPDNWPLRKEWFCPGCGKVGTEVVGKPYVCVHCQMVVVVDEGAEIRVETCGTCGGNSLAGSNYCSNCGVA